MAVINVYRRYESIIHKSTICSKASLVVILTAITSIVTPLIMTYKSHGMWIKEAEYREQPDINFKYQALLITDTSVGSLTWSSSSAYNSLMADYVRTPLIKSTESDDNHDGLKDMLHFSLELPLLPGELVYGATLILTFNFRLQYMCKVTLEGIGLVQHSSGLPVTSVHHYADLTLFQRHPLPYSKSNTQYNTSVFPLSPNSPQDWILNNILHKYWERNLSTHFTNTFTTWQTGSSDVLTLTLDIQYPQQKISYIPGFWYVLKWAWMQYFSIFVIILFITNSVKDWVFKNFIVSTWVDVSEIKKK